MRKSIKKRPMTLIEIMIVIFIIGIIGGVLGYNMKGSLDEGKAFKTKEGSRQIYEIFTLEIAKGSEVHKILDQEPEQVLRNSGLVKNPRELLADGWGTPYEIKANNSGNSIRVISKKYKEFQEKKNKKELPYWMDETYEE